MRKVRRVGKVGKVSRVGKVRRVGKLRIAVSDPIKPHERKWVNVAPSNTALNAISLCFVCRVKKNNRYELCGRE